MVIVKISCFQQHSVVKWKIYSRQKIFRQINSLVISLVNTLVSRNFCQKSVRVNSWNCEWFSHRKNISWNQLSSNFFRQIRGCKIQDISTSISIEFKVEQPLLKKLYVWKFTRYLLCVSELLAFVFSCFHTVQQFFPCDNVM